MNLKNINEIIDSEKFAQLADYIFSEFTSIENFQRIIKNENKTILETKNEKNIGYVWYVSDELKIKSNSIVFCQADLVEYFFSIIKEYSDLKNIILITHQSDRAITGGLFRSKPHSITKWFATNVCYYNENLIPIPLGVNNLFYKVHPNRYDIEKVERKLLDKKENLIYSNFNINTRHFHRHNALRESIKSKFCKVETNKLNKQQYLNEISNYRYILCPWGNGYDTHRVWESMYLDSTPVVKKNRKFRQVLDIPLIEIDTFKNLDINKLKVKNDSIYEKLNFSYWANIIKNEVTAESNEVEINKNINFENQHFRINKNKLNKLKSLKKQTKYFIFRVYKKFLKN